MECTGRCVAVSEPNSPDVVAMRYDQLGDSAEIRQLARNVIRWECRPYQTLQPQPIGYFLKVSSASANVLPLLRKVFPDSRALFMYRDVATVAKSSYRCSMVVPSLRVLYILCKLSGNMTQWALNAMGFNGANFCVRLDNDLTFGILLVAVSTVKYLEMRQRGDDIRAVRYENLVARPLDMCRVILEYCHFPVSLAEVAVRAFDTDSHTNSPIAKSIIGKFQEPEMTPKIKAKLNELLKTYGLPLIGEPGILEGTISCSS